MIFLLAFSTLLYEIVISRVFAYVLPYHFTPLALSLAMLGLGAGACLRVLRGGRDDAADIFAALSASFLVFNAALLVRWGFWTTAATAFAPFLFLGLLFAGVYAASKAPHRTYFWDLTGAAAACLVALRVMSWIGPDGVTLGLAAVFGAAGFARARRRPQACAAALALAALLARAAGTLPDFGAAPRSGGSKPMHEAMRRERGTIVDSSWDAAGRADIYEHPSFANIKWIYNDATNSSYLVREPKTPAMQDFLRGLSLGLPMAARRPKRVLIIGPGGGAELQLARLFGADDVDAVEINPATVSLVRKMSGFAGVVYDAPGVNTRIKEGRAFLAESGRRPYDLIQMSLTFTSTALSGSFALAEGRLYTKEAFRLFLSRLTPRGVLAVLDDSAERSLREALTALAVMREDGVPFDLALRRIAVIANPGVDGTGYAHLLLASPEELSPELRRELMALCARGQFTPVWIPDMAAREPYLSLSREGLDSFLARQPLDLRPRTDDYPYFFYFGKGWRSFWDTLKPMIGLCFMALLLTAWAGARLRRELPSGAMRAAVLAGLCGAGFMLTQAGLLHKLTPSTGTPAQALTVLLFSLLFWCGLGGRLAERLGLTRAARLGFPAAAAAAGAYLILWRHGSGLESVESESLRRVLTFLALAPAGLCLGIPFPSLLGAHVSKGETVKAWLWAINGFASVAGACLSMLIPFLLGINAGLAAGFVVYLAGALIVLGSKPRGA